ncbi:MAG: hypothetical protein ATN31_09200 [Candidatus Epulonipiscioides saccharophilum]|nr:MAG: hypothetical protein ATN31_09200 [Epulopiscium sp. AS2M-Bin001]
MKILKKCLMFASCAMFFMLPTISSANDHLPEEVKALKSAYDTFETLLDKYDHWVINQVNDQEERLKVLKFGVEPFTLAEGETKEVEIPADLMRVISAFDKFDVYGSGFNKTNLIEAVIPTKGNIGAVSSPWIADTHYQIRITTFTLDHVAELARGDEAYSGYKFILTGPVDVKGIELSSNNGASMTMDTTAWEVLGGDKEILDGIEVTVDATNRLSIEGITTFEGDKFRNHAGSASDHPDTQKTSVYYTSKNFYPGRQIYKFGPTLEIGYDASLPKLKEDPENPGYATYDVLKAHMQNGSNKIAFFDRAFGEDLEYTLCFDNWPSW